MDEFLIMKIEGNMIEFMVQEDPEKYRRHVCIKNGKEVLYVHILKTLYDCMRSGFLWYNLFLETLQSHGFKLNPYDSYVANKIMNGKQCTITWYIDDLKISHVDHQVVTNIISMIDSEYGTMTITRGSKDTYIGIDIDIEFIGDGKVTLHQPIHIEENIEYFGEDVTTTVSSATQKYLFRVEDLEKLSDELRMKFHRIFQKLLFVSKRSRSDL